ncbi:hypothetical protein LUZ60_013246 [Juncus effusus]|nr:hypothetical protein LUZ60_013246 [Juncus effusus]
MASSLAHALSPVLPFQRRKPRLAVTSALVAGTYPMTSAERSRETLRLKFEAAFNDCREDPYKGLSFTEDDMLAAIDESLKRFKRPEEKPVVVEPVVETPGKKKKWKREKEEEIIQLFQVGDTVRGGVFIVREDTAYVDIGIKAPALLHLDQSSILPAKNMFEAGIFPGLVDDFTIIAQNRRDDTFIVSLKDTQYNVAWERCRQLQAEDVPVVGTVISGNAGGVVAIVEGLSGFIPFSQVQTKDTDAEELMGQELALKILEVDQEQSRLVLSNRKAMADSQAQLGIGSVVLGTVESIKPYGAFIDIGGINGLLHVSQISHDRVADISTVLAPGDSLKVMILSHDRERGRVSLSTKKLEPTPGDMIRNPELVFEKADEMAQIFRQRIAQAEAMARADMLRFQPESGLSLSSDGLLGPLSDELPDDTPAEGGFYE